MVCVAEDNIGASVIPRYRSVELAEITKLVEYGDTASMRIMELPLEAIKYTVKTPFSTCPVASCTAPPHTCGPAENNDTLLFHVNSQTPLVGEDVPPSHIHTLAALSITKPAKLTKDESKGVVSEIIAEEDMPVVAGSCMLGIQPVGDAEQPTQYKEFGDPEER